MIPEISICKKCPHFQQVKSLEAFDGRTNFRCMKAVNAKSFCHGWFLSDGTLVAKDWMEVPPDCPFKLDQMYLEIEKREKKIWP